MLATLYKPNWSRSHVIGRRLTASSIRKLSAASVNQKSQLALSFVRWSSNLAEGMRGDTLNKQPQMQDFQQTCVESAFYWCCHGHRRMVYLSFFSPSAFIRLALSFGVSLSALSGGHKERESFVSLRRALIPSLGSGVTMLTDDALI